MRTFVVLALLTLPACQVSKDEQNDTVTATFNQDVAENGLEEAANAAENIGRAIASDVENAAARVENETERIQHGNEAN